MTKEQFDKKFQELVNQVPALLKERAEYLFKSGAIELGDYGDDFALPKIVLTAALHEALSQFYPFTPEYRQEVNNLLKF